MQVKLVKNVLRWMWLTIDPKGCLTETTTKKEREAMGIDFDER